MNIDLPIFATHGNHDYPSSRDCNHQISILDIFQAGNFVNYYGK
jgi:DNA repair exonuclease SbcCD nuclease subunit